MDTVIKTGHRKPDRKPRFAETVIMSVRLSSVHDATLVELAQEASTNKADELRKLIDEAGRKLEKKRQILKKQ